MPMKCVNGLRLSVNRSLGGLLLTTPHPGATTPSTDGKSTPLAGQLAHTLLWAGVPIIWARTPGAGSPRAAPDPAGCCCSSLHHRRRAASLKPGRLISTGREVRFSPAGREPPSRGHRRRVSIPTRLGRGSYREAGNCKLRVARIVKNKPRGFALSGSWAWPRDSAARRERRWPVGRVRAVNAAIKIAIVPQPRAAAIAGGAREISAEIQMHLKYIFPPAETQVHNVRPHTPCGTLREPPLS